MSDPLLTSEERYALDAERRPSRRHPVAVAVTVSLLAGALGGLAGANAAYIMHSAEQSQVQPPLPCTGRVP